MAKNKVMFAEYEPKNCKDVFSAINTRQITALMFHDEMADLFDFLGLTTTSMYGMILFSALSSKRGFSKPAS